MSKLDDGFKTTITFSSVGSGSGAVLELYEKEVTPPGVSGGGPIDTTTMHNTTWRSNMPKQLKTLSAGSFVAAYDPAVYNDIVAMVNVNQEITVTFPDASTLVFWGWLDNFTPSALVEGEQPTADVTIQPSNIDGNGNEIAPVHS